MSAALPRSVETPDAGRVRFIRVAGDHMEPTLRPQDYVAVIPTDRWHYDSLYVLEALDTATVYRCQHVGGGQIRITTDRDTANAQLMPMERFQELVLGIVAATCRVLDVGMMEGAAS